MDSCKSETFVTFRITSIFFIYISYYLQTCFKNVFIILCFIYIYRVQYGLFVVVFCFKFRTFALLYCLVFVPEAPNKNISECLGANLRTVQTIRKEFGEPHGDYEGTAAREAHSFRSDKKISPEFVSEIKTVIDNDSTQSMRAIYSKGYGSV